LQVNATTTLFDLPAASITVLRGDWKRSAELLTP
jgi:hypothetical protein